MYFVGFKRLDFALFHVFLDYDDTTSSYKVMLIDTAKAMKKSYSCPSIALGGLHMLKCKDNFLDYVKNNYPEIYSRWFPKDCI